MAPNQNRKLVFAVVQLGIIWVSCDGIAPTGQVGSDAGPDEAPSLDAARDTRTTRNQDASARRDSGVFRADASPVESPSIDAAVVPELPANPPRGPAGPFDNEVLAPRRIVAGLVQLVGQGHTSCSTSAPGNPTAHIWCAFSRAAEQGNFELWVIDVTVAEKLDTSACDGTETHCLRLTQNLWTGPGFLGPIPPYAHHFDGETLVYYADARSKPDENHKGPIYAWRPGWSSGRQISSMDGFLCEAHESAPVAFCLDSPRGEEFSITDFEVRVGRLDNAAANGGSLPVLGRLTVESRFKFSPDGEQFAFSSGDPISGQTLLRVVETSKVEDVWPRILLVGADSWELSHDGRTVYFLERGVEDSLFGRADFPSGANVIRSLHPAYSMRLLGKRSDGVDSGVGLFNSRNGIRSVFQVVKPSAPTQAIDVFEFNEPIEDFHLTADPRFVSFAQFDGGGFNGYLARLDGSGQCQLSDLERAPAMEVDVPVGSPWAFWLEKNEETRVNSGQVSSVSDCGRSEKFADGLSFHVAAGMRDLVFADQRDERTVSLKYVRLSEVGKLGRTVRIADWVDDTIYLPSAPNGRAVFSMSTGLPENRGLYVFRIPELAAAVSTRNTD